MEESDFLYPMSNSFYECHVPFAQSQKISNKNHLRIIRIKPTCFEWWLEDLIQSILDARGWPKNEFGRAPKGKSDM